MINESATGPAEPLDYRRCPRPECGGRHTIRAWRREKGAKRVDSSHRLRYCLSCRQVYRVTFRAVASEAE
jgi:hypothetical protein